MLPDFRYFSGNLRNFFTENSIHFELTIIFWSKISHSILSPLRMNISILLKMKRSPSSWKKWEGFMFQLGLLSSSHIIYLIVSLFGTTHSASTKIIRILVLFRVDRFQKRTNWFTPEVFWVEISLCVTDISNLKFLYICFRAIVITRNWSI